MAILNKMTPNLGRIKAKRLKTNTSANILHPTTDLEVFEKFAEVHLPSYWKVIVKLLQSYSKHFQSYLPSYLQSYFTKHRKLV